MLVQPRDGEDKEGLSTKAIIIIILPKNGDVLIAMISQLTVAF